MKYPEPLILLPGIIDIARVLSGSTSDRREVFMTGHQRQWLRFWVCIATLGVGFVAHAASFGCARATLPAEKAICANANLGSLDERVAGMYFLIIGSGAPAATIARVKQVQSRFVTRRNACGANIDCLVDAYTDQSMFLRNEKSNLGL